MSVDSSQSQTPEPEPEPKAKPKPTTNPYTCAKCGEPRSAGTSFCSEECRHAHIGENILSQIKRDHTICSSCHRLLKRIERPPDSFLQRKPPEVAQSIIGYEYPTQDATVGMDERDVDTGNPYRRIRFTRVGCECGNVDPSERIELLDDMADGYPANRLYEALCRMHEKGAIDTRPDWQRFKAAFEDNQRLAICIGRALSD